ncbi:hypothetical protein AYI70_g6186 [Smittium culicis]|uniref:Uncharacterized protein n=1 Tax=Smittium culicis TaxID=133412 RepID=A0A1R1XR76_9FUNG|nr:hypothetical protein AYI70_g6186 [Smittium culicis]
MEYSFSTAAKNPKIHQNDDFSGARSRNSSGQLVRIFIGPCNNPFKPVNPKHRGFFYRAAITELEKNSKISHRKVLFYQDFGSRNLESSFADSIRETEFSLSSAKFHRSNAFKKNVLYSETPIKITHPSIKKRYAIHSLILHKNLQ